LIGALGQGRPERLLSLYPWLSLIVLLAFASSVYLALRGDDRGQPERAWQAALLAGFATLLSTTPLDHLARYRAPFVTMFLLKPNHALGLVLMPLLLLALARHKRRWQLLAIGVGLQLLGWVFVIHMLFVASGLVLFALRERASGRADGRSAPFEVAVVIGLNLTLVSPYLWMLASGYPFALPLAMHTIQASSPHVLEGSLLAGWLWPLALVGFVALERRGERLDRLLTAQWLTALLVWLAYLGLSWVALARELDEAFQWLRFLTALLAGYGAWELAGWTLRWLRPTAVFADARRALLVAAVSLPLSLPVFWDPARMDPFFQGSLEPIPKGILAPAAWIAANTQPHDILTGDREFANWAAALTGRRVLFASRFHGPPRGVERARLEQALVTGGDASAIRQLTETFGVRYLVVTRRYLLEHGSTLEALQARPELELVYRGDPFTLLAVAPAAIFRLRMERPS